MTLRPRQDVRKETELVSAQEGGAKEGKRRSQNMDQMPETEKNGIKERGNNSREVLGRGEVRQAECMPQHDVGVVDGRRRVRGDPRGQVRVERVRHARCLRNVAAGGMDLRVGVWRTSFWLSVSQGKRA